jgi:peptidoglycan/LPS O-acetylase OafA/YrhL
MVLLFHGDISWMRGGFLGVDVFFVLSGFLITRLLLEERVASQGIALLRFYGRRALRLFPALAVLLVVITLYAVLFLPSPQQGWTLHDVWTSALYQLNWWRVVDVRNAYAISPLDHTWSLAIEWQFYLIWPLVFLVLYRVGGVRGVAIGAIAGAVASALLRAVLWETSGLTRTYFGLDTHADGLLIGAALAALTVAVLPSPATNRGIRRAAGPVALVAILGFGLFSRLHGNGLPRGGYLVFALLVTVVIVDVLSTGPLSRALAVSPMVAIGRISYGLYLWHWPVFFVLRYEWTALGFWPTFVMYLAASFALAAFSHRFVERPARRWKDRLEPRARQGVNPT